MFDRRNQEPSPAQSHAEDAIVSTLRGGGDSLPAWNAIWDLVQSSDSHGKQEVLDALRGYVQTAVAGDDLDTAQAFETALEESLQSRAPRRQVLPSREVRAQYKRDQFETHRQAMKDIGVRPGEGLPMWALYMTRRSKRSWG